MQITNNYIEANKERFLEERRRCRQGRSDAHRG